MSALARWRVAFERGAQWRYLLVYVVGTLVPSLVLFAPVHGFLAALFDHSTREADVVPALDSGAFFEVLKQLDSPEAPDLLGPALAMVVIAVLVVGPALAGSAAVVAEREAPARFRDLLAAAGAYYPRMLRMLFASIVPLGVAIALSAGILHVAERAEMHAVLETSARRTSLASGIAVAVVVWLAQSTAEVGRAVLVAEPERRSAFLAWWRGIRFTARRVPEVLGLCAATTLAALAVVFALTALRLRLTVTGPVSIAVEFVVAQAAIAALGWGRSSRLAGLVDMLRAEE